MKNSAKRRKLVVGNWKMNPQTHEEARKTLMGIKKVFTKIKNVDVVVCAPYPYLFLLGKGAYPVLWGAQDVFWETSGSFTGEISAHMLVNSGCTHVIIGHSERRTLGETDEVVSKKIFAAVGEGLKVIVCVGEKERDEHGQYLEFLKNQLRDSFAKVPKRYISQLIIAYEPLWAIGKSYNTAMTGKDMQEISIFIKKILADLYSKDESAKTPILYGGSVAPINATDLIESGQIDGFLVGRQSLEAGSFNQIIEIVSKTRIS